VYSVNDQFCASILAYCSICPIQINFIVCLSGPSGSGKSTLLNASDGSLLAQPVSSYDIKQDIQLLAVIGLPAGADGSEYGSIDSGIPRKPLSFGASLFVQLAAYF